MRAVIVFSKEKAPTARWPQALRILYTRKRAARGEQRVFIFYRLPGRKLQQVPRKVRKGAKIAKKLGMD